MHMGGPLHVALSRYLGLITPAGEGIARASPILNRHSLPRFSRHTTMHARDGVASSLPNITCSETTQTRHATLSSTTVTYDASFRTR
jgi:hypothetical protein